MRRGIRGDGTAASVSRFGSVYAIGFDMSKSIWNFLATDARCEKECRNDCKAGSIYPCGTLPGRCC